MRPFQIRVPDAELDDLRDRLAKTRWPDAIPGVGWEYGIDLDYLRSLCEYWRTRYDWRAREAEFNRWPQFLHEVDGVDIHFWHVKGKGPNPLPLLLAHGWPGSMVEFHAMLGPLTDPEAHGGDARDAFDIVVPALPGFGFGGKIRERGWGPARMARAFDRLMQDLGYRRYGTQGGDYGYSVTTAMGALFPDRVAGCHINFLGLLPPDDVRPDEEWAVQARRDWEPERGYAHIQNTKPQTLTVAQADSPAGTAAWIVEKFWRWSDHGGDIESVYTKDQLLDNVMFYWAPNSSAGSARIYFESVRDRELRTLGRVEVPVAFARFPKELYPMPRRWAEKQYNITRWTGYPKGGHFAAMEQPAVLTRDVREFFRELR